MCMSCGCGDWNNDHGNAKNITLDEMKAAASAQNIGVEQAADNIHNAARQYRAQQQGGAQASGAGGAQGSSGGRQGSGSGSAASRGGMQATGSGVQDQGGRQAGGGGMQDQGGRQASGGRPGDTMAGGNYAAGDMIGTTSGDPGTAGMTGTAPSTYGMGRTDNTRTVEESEARADTGPET